MAISATCFDQLDIHTNPDTHIQSQLGHGGSQEGFKLAKMITTWCSSFLLEMVATSESTLKSK